MSSGRMVGALVAMVFWMGAASAKEPSQQGTTQGQSPGMQQGQMGQQQMGMQKQMEMPRPAAELGQLKDFVGRWTCGGSSPATEFGPAREFRASATVEPIAEGHWQSVRFEEEKSATNPMAMKVQGLWGYDPVNNQFVRTFVDSMGGYERNATAKGWEGNKFVWKGESIVMGQILPFRHTFTRVGERQLSDLYEVQKEGRWISLGTTNCSKATAAARRPPAER